MTRSIVLGAALVAALACGPAARADDAPQSGPAAASSAPAAAVKAPKAPNAGRAAPEASRGARTELQLEATQITGNRELPKVMVIVPWKSAEPAALAGRPLNSLVEELLSPIDRDVMRRTLDYYRLVADGPASDAGSEQAARTEPTNQ
jgi:hypothetical protein